MLKKNLKTKIKKYIYQMQGHDLEPKPNMIEIQAQ